MASQCWGAMLVLSRFRICRQSARQNSEMEGMWLKSCSVLSSGVRPLSVSSEAMVPPVPMSRIRFIGLSSL